MRPALIAALSLAAAATAGAATAQSPYQSWSSQGGDGARSYGYETGRHYSNPYRHDDRRDYRDRSYNGQADQPGDYRCDAFWDANRTDCSAGWRDQRHRSSYGYGYGRGQGRGHGYGYGYGHDAGGSVYPGAYGRPDLVYPAGRGGYAAAGSRDPARMDWCRRNYRSYDAASGYYRAYSGRLIWCG